MSRTKAELLEELQHKLQVPPRLPGSAAELGYEVFLLSKELQSCNDPDGARLTRTYHEYVTNHKCFGMVQNQIEYAIRLASDQGDLLYEEMSKLFSLRDEIEALKTLGYVGDREGYIRCEQALRNRFQREKRKAQLVAQDRANQWNRGWWWYVENVPAEQSVEKSGPK
jgi:hypothetical protein